MRCIKLFSVCIIILWCNCYSQKSPKVSSIKDSTFNFNPINKNDLKFKNFFRTDVRKRIENDLMLALEFYHKAINDSVILLQPYNLDLKEYPEEDFKSFRESFSLLMELAKKDRNKYDLGFVTKYLGISQKVVAIILAIISVAK